MSGRITTLHTTGIRITHITHILAIRLSRSSSIYTTRFLPQTPTGFCIRSQEAISTDSHIRATQALAFPYDTTMFMQTRGPQCNETTKYFVCEISVFSHSVTT